MSNTILLNIAFAPLPEAVVSEAVRLNGEYRQSEYIILGPPQGCYPHITLLMVPVQESNLPRVYEVLEALTQEYAPFRTGLREMYSETIPSGQPVTGLAVHQEPMQGFLVDLGQRMQPLLESYDNLDTSMLYDSASVTNMSVDFAIGSGKKILANPKDWFPHITLYVGNMPDDYVVPSNAFALDTVSVFHLGPYGTCKKLLRSFVLRGLAS